MLVAGELTNCTSEGSDMSVHDPGLVLSQAVVENDPEAALAQQFQQAVLEAIAHALRLTAAYTETDGG